MYGSTRTYAIDAGRCPFLNTPPPPGTKYRLKPILHFTRIISIVKMALQPLPVIITSPTLRVGNQLWLETVSLRC